MGLFVTNTTVPAAVDIRGATPVVSRPPAISPPKGGAAPSLCPNSWSLNHSQMKGEIPWSGSTP